MSSISNRPKSQYRRTAAQQPTKQMTTIRQQTKSSKRTTFNNGEYNCHQISIWTIVIIGVIILMTVSVVLAIVFPYRGDDVVDVDLLRGVVGGVEYDVDSDVMMSSSNAVGDVHDGIHSIGGDDKKDEEDGHNGHSSEGANNVNDDGRSSSSVLLSGGRGENDNEEQTSNELLIPLDSSSTLVDNMNKQHSGGGLFDYDDSTPYDPTKQQQQSQTQSASSSITSSISSCQTKLQQADIDMNEIIDSSEYISFLRDYVVNNNVVDDEEEDTATNKLATVIDFEELPIEYQVNFNHLATTKMIQSNSGGSSSNGIPIATLEEIQKVCLYLSNKGSSAIDEFDWGQISTVKQRQQQQQQQQNEGM
jgi:hypothetical protein